MIVTKQNLRLIVGVLVIYCCIETTVGGSIRVLNKNEPTDATTLSQNVTTETDQSTETTVTTKVHRRPTMPHRKKTTTENPSTTPEEGLAVGYVDYIHNMLL